MINFNENEAEMKELEKVAFKVDLLPKNFRKGALFIMNGYTFIHLGNQKALIVSFEGDNIELPRA